MGLFGGAFKGQQLGKTLGLLGGSLAGGLAGGGPGMMAGGLLGSQLFRLLGHRGGQGKPPGMGFYGQNLDLGAGPPSMGMYGQNLDLGAGDSGSDGPVMSAHTPNSFSEIMQQLEMMRQNRSQGWDGGWNRPGQMSFRGRGY